VTTVRRRAHRGLRLPARLAAASFAAARRGGGPDRAPRPAALRWRRPPLRAAVARLAGTRPAARIPWSPHFHLYFGGVGESKRRVGAPSMRSDIVIGERVFMTLQRWDHTRTATHRTDRISERTRIAPGRVALASGGPPEARWPESMATRLVAPTTPFLAFSRRPSLRLAAESTGRGRPRPTRVEPMVVTSAGALRWRAQDRLADRRRGRRVRTTPAAAADTREALLPAVRARRPVPLVWRSAGPDPSRPPASPGREMTASLPWPSPPGRVGPLAVVPEGDRARPRVPVRAADLEPGVLDRLADDVIRRVERRARIERERRGL
jgi:hypothetical protein